MQQQNIQPRGTAVLSPWLFTTFHKIPVFYGKKQPADRTFPAASHCTSPHYQLLFWHEDSSQTKPVHSQLLSLQSCQKYPGFPPVIRIPTLQNLIIWKWQNSIGNNYKNFWSHYGTIYGELLRIFVPSHTPIRAEIYSAQPQNNVGHDMVQT